MKSRSFKWLFVLGLMALVVFIDQVTKSFAQKDLAGSPVHLLGPFYLRLEYNTGFAFSLGAGHPAVIAAVSLVAVVVILVMAARVKSNLLLLGVSLIAGGALGNVADRIFRHNGGAVIDFIYSGFWPTFNVADACVVAGVVVIMLSSLRKGAPKEFDQIEGRPNELG